MSKDDDILEVADSKQKLGYDKDFEVCKEETSLYVKDVLMHPNKTKLTKKQLELEAAKSKAGNKLAHMSAKPWPSLTMYDEKIASEVLDAISVSCRGLGTICKAHEHFPSEQTVMKWIGKYPEFSARYLEAKAKQALILSEAILDVEAEVERFRDDQGQEKVDGGIVSLAKMRIDALKWQAARLAPRYYGDKGVATTASSEMIDELKARKKLMDDANEKDY